MQTMTKALVVVFIASLFGTGVFAQGIDQGEFLSSMCLACHGQNGKGSMKIPKLRGLDAQDIIESMKGFQSGEESSTIMDRHAKGYTDDEIRAMAAYFSQLK